MSAWVGWSLAVAAVALGYAAYGWRGVVLAVTVVVFWLLLQFSRALRALREAAGRPVGSVDSAVMLHARLARGMRLPEVLKITRSLGRKAAAGLGGDPEVWAWADAAGDEVRVEMRQGRIAGWSLHRAEPPLPPQPTVPAAGTAPTPDA